ncbi:MAG: invasion associated locus B family protein [Reyranellaceae bacterium]
MTHSLIRTLRRFALVLALGLPGSAVIAQAQKPAAQTPPAAQARTEILTYENWTVTCRDATDPKEKRICSAELVISQEANNQRRPVFVWILGLNKDNQPANLWRFITGISVQPGLELKFADKSRKVPISTCEPSFCDATLPVDDAFAKEASALVQAEAVIQTNDGRQITFTINMKGFAQALAAIRR